MVLSHPVVIDPAPGVAPARPDFSVVPLPRADSTRHVPIRSTEMHLLHEQLARAHSDDLSARAAAADRHLRMVMALKAQRKAERAALRARRLMVLAVTR